MPIPAAVIAALIGAAATATSTGLELAGVGQPSVPKVQPPSPTAAPTGPTKAQILSASAPYAANIQAQTGGSLSPDYYAQNAPFQAGVAGEPNTANAMRQLIAQIFGASPGGAGVASGSSAGVPFTPSGAASNSQAAFAANPGVSDFMQKMASELT